MDDAAAAADYYYLKKRRDVENHHLGFFVPNTLTEQVKRKENLKSITSSEIFSEILRIFY